MSNSIRIESNVPLPKDRPRNLRLYPWLDMKLGESFVVSGRTAACAARGSFRRYQSMGKLPSNWRVKQQVVEDSATDFVVRIRMWVVEE
jgi:hypothetical protein